MLSINSDATPAFDFTLERLTGALTKGETVQLAGFGDFAVSDRAERSRRNPSTDEAMTIKASKQQSYTASKALNNAG